MIFFSRRDLLNLKQQFSSKICGKTGWEMWGPGQGGITMGIGGGDGVGGLVCGRKTIRQKPFSFRLFLEN